MKRSLLLVLVSLVMASCGVAASQTVTPTPEFTVTPTVSPKPTLVPTATPTPLGGGGQIAFISQRGGGGMDKGSIGLYRVDTGETIYPPIDIVNEQEAEQGLKSSFGAWDVSLSSDGKRLAFSYSRCPIRAPGQLGGTACKEEIYVSDVAGTNIIELTHNSIEDQDPSWSSDGTMISWLPGDWGHPAHIYLMRSDGSNRRRLTHEFRSDYDARWSPDGQHIAFVAVREGYYGQIYVMNVDGIGGVVQLTSMRNSIFEGLAWSSDGTGIAFAVSDNKFHHYDVFRMDASGANVQNLTNGRYIFSSNPTWSPDGQMLAFNCNHVLCMMNADGTGTIEVKHVLLSEIQSSLSWSPP